MNKFFACLIILGISGLSSAEGVIPSYSDIDNPKGYRKNDQGFSVDKNDGGSVQCKTCGLFWAKSCRPRDNVNGKRTTELCDTQYTDGYCGTSHGSFICNGGYYKDGPHANQPQGCQDCDDLEPPA
ncbi:hypothetical protein PGT21_018291 [Puccinia graminis f. sp. tritici]|uniref:Uncharacterized protein n=1 Tax=Puccinia graminis f. sp. tritici TaxID=56615 RepID=A0A5B0PAW3_PUCGR|nr:hypothetical protein PGT21_018291 [Puccinia graminis f. sp. tritici]KAA1126040.1 hypothetical protein PGTUg99_016714 [Puccinia graminis f. sp. tritici]